MAKRTLHYRFPLRGVHLGNAFEAQPEGTTPYALNVMPSYGRVNAAASIMDRGNRFIGGRRMGLEKYYTTQLGSGDEVWMLASVGGLLVASSNGLVYEENSVAATFASAVTSDINLPTIGFQGPPLLSADLDGKLYINFTAIEKVSGSDGVIGSGVLDSASVADWTTKSIDTDNDVVVITDSSTGEVGTFAITSIDGTNGLTLASPPGDATGAVFSVIKSPIVYDPTANTLALWIATDGFVPVNCPLICRYRGRIVCAGDGTSAIYMSRQGDALDFDFGANLLDPARAVVLVASAFGESNITQQGGISQEPTALIPMGDDYLLIATDTELWLVRGDPAAGGTLDNVSRTIGIKWHGGWCYGRDGEVYFLSQYGLHAYAPGGRIANLSEEALPSFWAGLNPNVHFGILAYDPARHGVFVFMSTSSGGDASVRNVYVDLTNGSFWPLSFDKDFEPMSAITHKRAFADNNPPTVLLGCRDGYVRAFTSTLTTTPDDGNNITSHVVFGPIPLGIGNMQEGRLDELSIVLSKSDGVSWAIFTGDTAEDTVRAAHAYLASATGTPGASGSFDDDNTVYARPRLRGCYAAVAITGTQDLWEIERMSCVVSDAGRWRP